MTSMDEFDFSGAMGAEVAKDSNKGGGFAREVEYLSLDGSNVGMQTGKNQMLLRPLTDTVRRDPSAPVTKYNLPWITANQHYAQTKPKPEYAREDANWPGKMGAGCRADKIFAAKYPAGCMFCQRGDKASARTWCLAVEREEVRGEQGQVLGYRDKTREVFARDEQGNAIIIGKRSDGKDEYQMKTAPAYVVINQGWKNFFGPWTASAGYYDAQNISGLLSADWVVTRSGAGNNDTTYTFIRVSEQQVPEGNPFGLAAGTKYDLAIPGLMEQVYPDIPDLRKIVTDRVSDDYLGRFFVPGWLPADYEANKQQGGQQAQQGMTTMMMSSAPAPATPQATPGEEAPSSALEALKNRVTSGAGTAPGQPQQ